MKTSTTIKGIAALAASTALALGTAASASAQGNVIPGDDYVGRTVLVNQGDTELTITDVNRDTGVVSYTMTNRTGHNLRCEAPSPDERQRVGGTVSAAPVIQYTADFYSRYQFSAPSDVNVAFGIPILGNVNIDVPLWPLLQFLPSGSAAAFMSDRHVAQTAIVNGHREAQQGGLGGTRSAFTVNNGAEHTGTVQLGRQTSGERSEDHVGMIVMCGPGGTQGNEQLYAWTAFEEGWPPEDEAPTLDPAQGSLEAGSLGSAADGGLAGSTGEGALDTGSFGSATDVEGDPDDAAGSAGSATGS